MAGTGDGCGAFLGLSATGAGPRVIRHQIPTEDYPPQDPAMAGTGGGCGRFSGHPPPRPDFSGLSATRARQGAIRHRIRLWPARVADAMIPWVIRHWGRTSPAYPPLEPDRALSATGSGYGRHGWRMRRFRRLSATGAGPRVIRHQSPTGRCPPQDPAMAGTGGGCGDTWGCPSLGPDPVGLSATRARQGAIRHRIRLWPARVADAGDSRAIRHWGRMRDSAAQGPTPRRPRTKKASPRGGLALTWAEEEA